MSTVSAESVRCDIGRSPALTAWWLLVYGGAIVIAFLLPLAWGWRFLLAAAVSAALADALWRIAWRRGRRAITAIQVDSDGGVDLRRGSGDRWEMVEWRSPVVYAPVVLLRWRRAGRIFWRRLVIPADAVDPDCFRRVRVALRRRSPPD